MIRSWFLFVTVLVVGGLLVASFTAVLAQSGATDTPIPSVAADADTAVPSSATPGATSSPPTSAPTAAAAPSASSTGTGKLDIDALLPPGPGRDLVLQYCVNCHNIAPIVLARKTKDEWQYHRQDHSGRVAISKDELDQIYNYLTTYLTPDRPVPQLPPELLKDWTSY